MSKVNLKNKIQTTNLNYDQFQKSLFLKNKNDTYKFTLAQLCEITIEYISDNPHKEEQFARLIYKFLNQPENPVFNTAVNSLGYKEHYKVVKEFKKHLIKEFKKNNTNING